MIHTPDGDFVQVGRGKAVRARPTVQQLQDLDISYPATPEKGGHDGGNASRPKITKIPKPPPTIYNSMTCPDCGRDLVSSTGSSLSNLWYCPKCSKPIHNPATPGGHDAPANRHEPQQPIPTDAAGKAPDMSAPPSADGGGERCDVCLNELSRCGEMTADGPSLDCPLCRSGDAIEDLRKELAQLREQHAGYQKAIANLAQEFGQDPHAAKPPICYLRDLLKLYHKNNSVLRDERDRQTVLTAPTPPGVEG